MPEQPHLQGGWCAFLLDRMSMLVRRQGGRKTRGSAQERDTVQHRLCSGDLPKQGFFVARGVIKKKKLAAPGLARTQYFFFK